MIHPPDPPRAPTPHKADFVSFIIDNPAFEDENEMLEDKVSSWLLLKIKKISNQSSMFDLQLFENR